MEIMNYHKDFECHATILTNTFCTICLNSKPYTKLGDKGWQNSAEIVCVAAMIFKINFSFLPFFLELRIKRQRKKENTDLAESSIKAGNVFVPISKQILRR